MFSARNKSAVASSHLSRRLRLESLEPRVLLTTLNVGDWFVYRRGDEGSPFGGSLVEVEVTNDVTGVGTLELIGVNPQTGEFADIPGVLNGQMVFGGIAGDPCGHVIGPAPYTGQNEILAIAVDDQGNFYGVANSIRVPTLNAGVPADPNLTYPPYVGNPSPYFDPAHYWDATNLPFPQPAPPASYPDYDAAFLVRIDSITGQATLIGVLQNAYDPARLPTNPADPVANDEELVFNNVTAMDFDGAGNLWGIGITVDKLPPNPGSTPPQTYLPDAQAVGTPPVLLPFLFEIDPTPRVGLSTNAVNTTAAAFTTAGAPAVAATLLNDLDGLAVPYVNGDAILITGTDSAGNPISATYTIANAATATLGNLRNAISAAYPDAMAAIDAAGNLVLIADSAGPSAQAIALADAPGNTGQMAWGAHAFARTSPATTGPTEVWVPQRYALSLNTAQITSIAWDETRGLFYAVDASDNHLKIITPTGIVADVGALYIAGTNPRVPVAGMTGLDFDENGTLYGVANGNLYEIDKTDGACTQTGVIGVPDLSCLAYDENQPDWLWSIQSDPGGADRLVQILKKPPKPTDPFVLYVAAADAYTQIKMAVCIPYGTPPFGLRYYTNLQGASFNLDDLRLWNAPSTPYIGTVDGVDYYAPAGSGGVLVGAVPSATPTLPYRFAPVYAEFPLQTVPAIGTFPGGDVHAGITVAETVALSDALMSLGPLGYNDVQGLAADAAGRFFGVDNATGHLFTVDPASGVATDVAGLSIAYSDVNALDFDASGTLWGVGVDTQGDERLITIDTATAAVTEYSIVTMPSMPNTVFQITSIAFDPSGTLYAVDGSLTWLSRLGTLDTATGVLAFNGAMQYTMGWTYSVSGVSGIDFTDDGTLYAIAPDQLYYVDPATAECYPLPNLGFATFTSLTYDPTQPGYLWSVDSLPGSDELVRIDLGILSQTVGDTGFDELQALAVDRNGNYFAVDNTTGFLISIDQATGFGTAVAQLVGYTNIRALDFDPNDLLWAVGDNALSQPTLFRINTATGAVTQAVALAPALNVSSIAFDSLGNLYGLDAGNDELVLIDRVTGLVTPVTTLDVSGITGIDFVPGDDLYGVDADNLYQIDTMFGTCTLRVRTPYANLSALAYNPREPSYIWSIESVPGGTDQLVRLYLGFTGVRSDGEIGYALVGGTLAGRTVVPHSAEILHMGFFFGNIDAGGDLRTVYIRTDASAIPAGDFYLVPDYSTIDAQGTIGSIYVRGIMYAEVYAGGVAGLPAAGSGLVDLNDQAQNPLIEHELQLIETLAPRWAFYRYSTVDDNTPVRAQYLASESGNMVLWGYMALGDPRDYYALPLEAGQTVRIHAYLYQVTDPRMGAPFPGELRLYAPETTPRLTGPSNDFVATFGYETIEDKGIGSKGGFVVVPGPDGLPNWVGTDATQETLTFTAPAAGLYYIEVNPGNLVGVAESVFPYTIFISNGAPTTLGGMRVSADGLPLFTLLAPEFQDVYVNQGNLGALNIDDESLGVAVNVENGSLLDFEGGRVGYMILPDNTVAISRCVLVASGNIGRVAALNEDLVADIVAGADTGHGLDRNASIQNVWAARDLDIADGWVIMMPVISATGSIGRIYAAGDLNGSITIWANSDALGPASSIDMIEIGGDYGGLAGGRPTLRHGPDGNVRFLHVGGTIYEDYGGWIGPLNPTVIDSSWVFNDDGGGVMDINPHTEMIDTGQVDPVTGRHIITEDRTTVRLWIVEVDDATGGVLARFETDGGVSFDATRGNRVEFGDFYLNGTDSTDTIGIAGGTTAVDVYYLHGGPIDSFANNTAGDIISGNVTGVRSLSTGGSIGYARNTTGAWIPGLEGRPAGADPVTFGWFFGRTNGLILGGVSLLDDQGLAFTGIESVKAGGSIADLFFTGGIRVLNVRANSDGLTEPDGWDGVLGTIYGAGASARIESIYVGDGLADDGSGYLAQAGIFSESAIGDVRISRRYEIINGQYRGLINGSIMAIDQIENITGTNGARFTGIAAGKNFLTFHCWGQASVSTGWIGTVSFSGPGAAIFDAEVAGTYVNAVKASVDSDGIWGNYISAIRGQTGQPAIGFVEAGGPGLRSTMIGATGGWIGRVRGIGPVGDVVENFIESTDTLTEISGRHIYGNGVKIPNRIAKIAASANINANYLAAGGIDAATVKGDFLGNIFSIAGPLYSMKIYGQFSSILRLTGPEVAYLKSLEVTGPIAGTITSAGKIGKIISKTGDISADISTTKEALNGDIDLIQAAGAFTGNLSSSRGLGRLQTYGNVGLNPETQPDLKPSVIDVKGSIGSIRILAPRNAGPSDLYSDLNVGGDIGEMRISGGLFGDLAVNGNIGKLYVSADIGAPFLLGGPPVIRGNIEVRGYLSQINLTPGSDLVGDFLIGGDITKISLKGGNILGSLTSLYGGIPSIQVTDGSILGNISANGPIGRIVVKNGDLGTAANPINITAQYGGIGTIQVTNGGIYTVAGVNLPLVDSVNGIVALGGAIGKIIVTNGTIAGAPISAATAIDSLTVKNGSLDVDVRAGTTLGKLTLKGGDVTGTISAETGIGTVSLASALTGTIRSGGPIKAITLTDLTGTVPSPAIISSAADIDKLTIKGNVANAFILAGFDVGPDGLLGTADDNAVTGGAAQDGNIKSISVKGGWADSIVALGVEPGPGNDFLAATTPADGESSLGKMTIKGTVSGTSGVVADTAIGIKKPIAGLATTIVDTPNTAYDASPILPATLWSGLYNGDPLTIKLTGGGAFKFDEATATILLDGTTAKSTLSLTTPRNSSVATPLQIAGGDDDALKTLLAGLGVTLDDVALDGAAKTVKAYDIEPLAMLTFAGGVGSFTSYATGPSSFSLDAGDVGKLDAYGDLAAGALTADSFGTLNARGTLGASLQTRIGGITKLTVAGDLTGALDSRSSVKAIKLGSKRAGGALTGDLIVHNGDLGTLDLYGDLTASIDVPLGGIKSVKLTNGDFRNAASPQDLNAIRSLTGLDTYQQRNGNYAGMISTLGPLRKVDIRGGTTTGRIFAMGTIGSLRTDGITNTLIASGANLDKAQIYGDMVYSYIFAGFSPGDDGYDPADHNRDDNWLDALTHTWAQSTPADEPRTGTIKRLDIYGDFMWSAVSAAVAPGLDGFIGTNDDKLEATGYILKATIRGRVVGTPFPSETYGFSAATRVDSVTVGGQPLGSHIGNVITEERTDPVGPPHVTGVDIYQDRVVVTFDQEIDLSTIHTAWFGGGTPTFGVYVSRDRTFDAADVNVSQTVLHQILYDRTAHQLSLALMGNTWSNLNAGTNFLITLDGDVVADLTGELLDGEYYYSLPSGDDEPAGDFVYRSYFGDFGDTSATALDLLRFTNPDDLADVQDFNVPLLIPNQPSTWTGAIRFRGNIGDNPALTGRAKYNDLDVFRVEAHAGDILYAAVNDFNFVVQVWTSNGLGSFREEFPDSLTGAGYYAETDTTYWISVCTDFFGIQMLDLDTPAGMYLGSYELVVHLFNDGNSNFGTAPIATAVGETGFEDLSSLASTPWGTFYSIDNASHQVLDIDPGTGQATPWATLTPGYTDIHALDIDPTSWWGFLWGVGRNPGNQLSLLEISPWSGTVFSDIPIVPNTIADISSVAFQSNGVLFAVNADNDALATIDTITGVLSEIGPIIDSATSLPVTGVTGIDFGQGDVLYAVAPTGLYTINATTASATLLRPLPWTTLSALTYDDSSQPGSLFSIDPSTSTDTLVRIDFEGDSTQASTPLTFDGYVAQPDDIDAQGWHVQIITAPDDVDLYSLGALPEGTPINITLLTRTIGSHALGQSIEAAVFNSNREIIASLYFPPYRPYNSTLPLSAYVDDAIIEAYAPADDVYYVAVWGGAYVPIDAYMPYDLTIQTGPPVIPVPVPPRQMVYLNFSGGEAAYLTGELGPLASTYLGPLNAATFGFYGPNDTQVLRSLVQAKVEAIYAGYSNIQFTQQRPLTGDYSTVFVSSDVSSMIGLLGIAEQIDSLNRDPNDHCVTFGGEYASLLNLTADYGYTLDDVATALANTAAHEFGHILGLNHQVPNTFPPYLLMAYDTTVAQTIIPHQLGRRALWEFLIGYENDDVLLRVIA